LSTFGGVVSYRVDRGRHLALSTFGGVAALTIFAAYSRARARGVAVMMVPAAGAR
jgi:hypothetical protein